MKINKHLALASSLALLMQSNITLADGGKASEKNLSEKIHLIEVELNKLKATQNASSVNSGVTGKNWEITSYGSMAYKSENIFSNTQDTTPERRAKTDLERVVLELAYEFDPKWQIEIELEYEHGGVGTALEYDGFEEFGEFESEIEAGGEVIVEKLEAKYTYNDNFQIKMGHIFIPMGLGTDLHKPEMNLNDPFLLDLTPLNKFM